MIRQENRASKIEDLREAQMEIHVGDDGVWVTLKAASGKSYTFQPVSSLAQRGYMGADTVREWCNDIQAKR